MSALRSPRRAGRRVSVPALGRAWVVAFLAVLAVMLSHGLDSETPAGHHPPAVHAAAVHGHGGGHEMPEPSCGVTAHQDSPQVDVPDGGDGHSHGTHVCLAGHPPQGPVLPGPALVSLPVAPAPQLLFLAAGASRVSQGVELRPPAGIQVLRV